MAVHQHSWRILGRDGRVVTQVCATPGCFAKRRREIDPDDDRRD